MNPANNPSRHSDYEKKDEPVALAKTLQSATESVSQLSRKHPGEPVSQKWSRMQTIVLFPSTSDKAILTHFATPVDSRQGKVPRNTSGNKKASSRVLTQNTHSSIIEKQENPVFSASTEGALFGQRSRRARQKKKTPINNLLSANMLTKKP